MLEVDRIDVFYGKFQALKELSMTVERDETVGVLGPNGHGKSTILKAISGLLRPARGCIRFEGQDISKLPTDRIAEKGIIQVPQGACLFPSMSVFENLLMGAYGSRSWKIREENLKIVFELFPQLQEKKNQKSSTLSGGERQMVAIGRGMMSSAKLLMLDEPFMGLAPIISQEILKKISEVRKRGISLLLVEERITHLRELADRIYLVENGRAVFEAKKDAFFANEYVMKTYLGSA